MQELAFMKRIAECEDIEGLPVLLDDFVVIGPRGKHICIVMDLLSSDLGSFQRQCPNKRLPSHIAKNIIYLVLEGVEQLHGCGIIHTDIKPDNILFGGIHDTRVDQELAQPLLSDEEFELDGERYPNCLSQPLPYPIHWDMTPHDAELISARLVGLGQAQWAGKQPTLDELSAPSLRAPEVILQSSFGPGLDIWSIGCITFELLTGHWLFDPENGGSIEDDHLAKMMELTGEVFTAETLQYARRREHFFDGEGKLRRIPELIPGSIMSALENYNVLDEGELQLAADFIASCLRLDPSKRPSALELQRSPWMKTAFHC